MDSSARKLILLVPPIRRARGFRLYARDGRRYLDLWQDGGAGILGARPTGAVNALKSDFEAGRHLPLPSDALSRAGRTLSALFPGYGAAACFSSEREAREYRADAAEWKPFLPPPDAEALLVLPPLPSFLRPAFVLLSDRVRRSGPPDGGFPLPSSAQVSAALRAIAAARKEESEGKREPGWKAFDAAAGGAFLREGPYLKPARTDDYEALFRACLARGALLSPDPSRPSIVPGEFSPGELSFLREAKP
jgi:hypothetical protein